MITNSHVYYRGIVVGTDIISKCMFINVNDFWSGIAPNYVYIIRHILIIYNILNLLAKVTHSLTNFVFASDILTPVQVAIALHKCETSI